LRTYSGSSAGSEIMPILKNARESAWIISPWLGKEYAKELAALSQRGIEVRIITSNVDYNIESLEILKASENPNLILLVLDKNKTNGQATFVHSKTYIIDKEHGISGSANLTYSGLNSNVESLSIAETEEEVEKMETDFMRIWMGFERRGMPKEGISSGTSYSLRNALPLLHNFGGVTEPNVKGVELVYHPYYFFEFSFRVSAGKSPPVLFEDSGFLVLDGATRQIINDNLLVEEIKNNPIKDYVLKTENKYRLAIHQQKIESFREARELVLNHIIEKNTRHYTQRYGNRYRSYGRISDYGPRSYDRIFVPYRNIVSFIKSGFVQVPVWYCEILESERRHYQSIVFGASGRKWTEFVYCPECQKKIWTNETIDCEICGTKVCNNCINEKGLIFKKKLCGLCLSKS